MLLALTHPSRLAGGFPAQNLSLTPESPPGPHPPPPTASSTVVTREVDARPSPRRREGRVGAEMAGEDAEICGVRGSSESVGRKNGGD